MVDIANEAQLLPVIRDELFLVLDVHKSHK